MTQNFGYSSDVTDGLVDGGVSTEPEHVDLAAIDGAWVEIRQMPYGDVLKRQDKVMQMRIQMAERGQQAASTMDLQMANVETTAHDFKACITRHNIRNPRTGRAFQFQNLLDWRDILNPKLGREIDRHIRRINGFDDEAEQDFTAKQGNGSGPESDLSQE